MIAIDTNVLVRYLVRDDPRQAESARTLLQEKLTADRPGYVTVAAAVELEWVLRTGYGFDRAAIESAVLGLLDAPNLMFEEGGAVRRAAEIGDGDFVGRLIHFIGAAAGCEHTLTFDRKFARLAGVELLKAN